MKFKVQYMSGKTNLAADAAPRYPTLISQNNLHDGDLINESRLVASLSNEVRRSITVTLEERVEETLNDNLLLRVF